ncbi:hypothetical protein LP417_27990 [Polaromonas sp. P1-6]|nr:hypothetical protein LP417_27990 [Polaromonas sp. P1-6]
MSNSNASKTGDFAHWVEERSEALKFKLGEKFPVPPTALHSPSVHVETGRQKLEEVLLEHEEPTPEFLEELAALEEAPPLSDEELAQQALAAGNTRQDHNASNETAMSNSSAPKTGDFAHWVDEKSEALKFELGEKFPVPPTALHSPSVHVETGRQKLEEVLLEHEEPTSEFLEELAALEEAPPLSDEELAKQALAAGGGDGDSGTPE